MIVALLWEKCFVLSDVAVETSQLQGLVKTREPATSQIIETESAKVTSAASKLSPQSSSQSLSKQRSLGLGAPTLGLRPPSNRASMYPLGGIELDHFLRTAFLSLEDRRLISGHTCVVPRSVHIRPSQTFGTFRLPMEQVGTTATI